MPWPALSGGLRPHRDERAVLVHGDVHQLNALQNDGGFKLIDPVGLLAEAEYDLGVLMRDRGKVRKCLDQSHNVVAGTGISASQLFPDFRGFQGCGQGIPRAVVLILQHVQRCGEARPLIVAYVKIAPYCDGFFGRTLGAPELFCMHQVPGLFEQPPGKLRAVSHRIVVSALPVPSNTSGRSAMTRPTR